MSQARAVAIIGGGLMGAGIAQVFAAAGYPVWVHDPVDEVRETVTSRVRAGLEMLSLDPAMAEHVKATANLGDAVRNAGFVIEAAPEKLPLKREIFAELERLAHRDAILASNTSVMPIGSIVEGLHTPERMIGTHWWNPAPLIPLVEVVQAGRTSDDTVADTMRLMTSVGKLPAHIRKDVPGFVANRLQHALWREAIAMVADGICDAATLDHCVRNSFGLRLAVLGPLENADLVGLDLTRDIHTTILPHLNTDKEPSPLLDRMIANGRLGFATGTGLQDWPATRQAETRARLAAHLLRAQPAASATNGTTR